MYIERHLQRRGKPPGLLSRKLNGRSEKDTFAWMIASLRVARTPLEAFTNLRETLTGGLRDSNSDNLANECCIALQISR